MKKVSQTKTKDNSGHIIIVPCDEVQTMLSFYTYSYVRTV